jgi:hypothetical protein
VPYNKKVTEKYLYLKEQDEIIKQLGLDVGFVSIECPSNPRFPRNSY